MIPIADSEKSYKIPFITWTIIAVNAAIFIYQLTLPDLDAFFYKYALVPSQLSVANWLTFIPFITSMFLHGGFMHIASNMLFLYVFGDNPEADMGHLKFLIFYMVGGIVASLAQLVFSIGSDIPSLGASGAIAAILGYYLLRFPDNRIKALVIYYSYVGIREVSAQYMLIVWGITQLFSGVGTLASGLIDQGGVAWFAHLGGFGFGLVVAWLVNQISNSGYITRVRY